LGRKQNKPKGINIVRRSVGAEKIGGIATGSRRPSKPKSEPTTKGGRGGKKIEKGRTSPLASKKKWKGGSQYLRKKDLEQRTGERGPYNEKKR